MNGVGEEVAGPLGLVMFLVMIYALYKSNNP
jgi:hypothetical protein